jgi:hypothetical protein
VIRKDDIERRNEDVTDRVLLQVGGDLHHQAQDDGLMTHVGRRRHVVCPVDELVPVSVVREVHEIVVREP